MHSEKLHVRVQYLEQKIMQLLERCKDQQEMIQQLRKEKEQLMQQGTNKTELVHNLSNSPALGTITKHEQKIRNWEARIDNYIVDIDKAIAYLKQL
jgi:chromosome segregation ATPase